MRTEGGGDDDVFNTLCTTEASLSKRKVTRNTQHGRVIESGSLLVEGTNTLGTDASVDAWEDVEDELLALEFVARQLGKISLDKGK